ncbi:unnamed protein product, partial [Discosporangium mesarthrocarpum]
MTYGGVQECVMSASGDASYAGDIDNRRSVTGGAVIFCGAAVAWMSKMQKVVALSFTESEYTALSSVAQEISFLRNVLEFIQPNLHRVCIEMFEDNDGASKLVKNAISTGRTKHIDVRHHFLRDLVGRKQIRVTLVKSADQLADVLTKYL